MKIAVTYDNGEVFQHFGHTENFKVYEVEDGKVVSSEIIASNCSGHDALAGFVAGEGIAVVLCGGIGEGAQNALSEAGIEVISGTEGNTDEVVEAYLRGELTSAGVNCDHHDHEEEQSCGCGGCSGGCGGCGGQGTRQSNGEMNMNVNLDMYTALLGGEGIVKLSNGTKIKLKIKPETQNGTKVRVRGKGYDRGDGTFGDLIITYNVKLPTGLNEKQKELLKQMKEAN